MGAGGHEINQAIKNCIADDGFWKDLGVGLGHIRAANYEIPHLDSTAGSDATDPKPFGITADAPGLTCIGAASSKFYLDFGLPMELADQMPVGDTTAPFQALRVSVWMYMQRAGGSLVDTPAITVTAKVYGADGVYKTGWTGTYKAPFDGSAPTTAVVAVEPGTATAGYQFVWDISGKTSGGNRMSAGDRVIVKFAVGSHTTDSLIITNANVRAKVNAANNAIQGTGNVGR